MGHNQNYKFVRSESNRLLSEMITIELDMITEIEAMEVMAVEEVIHRGRSGSYRGRETEGRY